jgi:NhaP-type Na+/H+ or K+/H+ antiporter
MNGEEFKPIHFTGNGVVIDAMAGLVVGAAIALFSSYILAHILFKNADASNEMVLWSMLAGAVTGMVTFAVNCKRNCGNSIPE